MPVSITRFSLFIIVAAAFLSLGAHVIHADHDHPAFMDGLAGACHCPDRKILLPLVHASAIPSPFFEGSEMSFSALAPGIPGDPQIWFDPFRIALREGTLHPKLYG